MEQLKLVGGEAVTVWGEELVGPETCNAGLMAAQGPLFRRTAVKVSVCPGRMGSGLSDSVMTRSDVGK
jgi:hypothetical protein